MTSTRAPRRVLLPPLLALLLAGALSSVAPAQIPGSPDTPAAEAAEEPAAKVDRLAEIQRKQAEIEAERKSRTQELAAAQEAELVEGPIVRELELLRRIESLYDQELSLAERARELERLGQEAERRLSGDVAEEVGQDPPFSLLLLDTFERQRDGHADQIRATELIVREMKRTLASAQAALEKRGVTERQDHELAEGAKDEIEGSRARSRLRIDELETREAVAERDLAALGLENARSELALEKRERQLAARAVEWAGANLEAGEDRLKEPLAALEKQEFDLKREQHAASRTLEKAERSLDEALGRLDRAAVPEPALFAEVEARRAERHLAQRRAFLAGELLVGVSEDRDLWERRHRNLEGLASRADLWTWQRELEELLGAREGDGRIFAVRVAELHLELDNVRQRAEADAAAGLPRARWVRHRARHLEELLQLHEATADRLEEGADLVGRVLAEVRASTARSTFGERVGAAVEAARRASRIELFAVGENSITLPGLVEAALLFAVGYLLSRLASRLVGILVLRRSGGAVGAASAVEGLVFYFLLLMFALLALRVVNIPLTAFTVAGGALAIGIGFGSQNLINNFLSGIIMMAERPIKVGDLIEVEGERGEVERIGPRATRVRTFANTHIIIPNSAFLETKVVNWTHADNDIRTAIEVGVAYGSPTREVERLIHRAVSEHGAILESPGPSVLFSEFGDSALGFRVYFWIRSRDMLERRRIESDIRYRIDNLFREAGIVIAFPQRDVHLAASQPLEVRVVEAEAEADED